jgi:TP901 family phage tail tape measure protein
MPATAQVRIAADTKQFKRSMDEVSKTMTKLKSQTSTLGRVMKGTFSLVTKLSAGLGGVALPAGIIASQKAYMRFEKQLTEVYTLLPNANRAFFKKMSDDALRFSETFNLMPEDVTRGMYQAISAGIDPATLMDDAGFMEIASKAAKAGVTDVRTAVDALTNVVNSYGDGVYDMSDVSDQMFTAVAMSKTTFRELADYMYQILPTAASTKIRLDDLLGSISALASTGTLTRVGTTQLRQMFIELSRQGDKAANAFQMASGGRPFEQFMRDGGRIIDVIQLIGKYAKANKMSIRNVFGSVEAGNAAVNLAKSLKLTGMIDAIEFDSAGMTDKAAEKVMGTQAARVGNIINTIANIPKRLGEIMKPMTDDIISYIEGKMEELREFDWADLAKRFANAWNVIKQLVANGGIWKYLYINAKEQIVKLLLQFQQLTANITAYFSVAGESLAVSLIATLNGLKDLGKVFVDFLIINFKRIAPALLLAFAPVLAGVQGMMAVAKDELVGGNEEKVAQAKEQAFTTRYGNLTEARFKGGDDFVQNELTEFRSNLQAYLNAGGDPKDFGGMREDEFGPDDTVAERLNNVGDNLAGAFDDISDEFRNLEKDAALIDGVHNMIRGLDKFAKEKFGATGLSALAGSLPPNISEDEVAQERMNAILSAKDMSIDDIGSEQYQVLKMMLNKARADNVGDQGTIDEAIKAMEAAESMVRRVVQTNDEQAGETEEISSGEIVYKEVFDRQVKSMHARASNFQRQNNKNIPRELEILERDLEKSIKKIQSGISTASAFDLPEVDLKDNETVKLLEKKLKDIKRARKAMEDSVEPLSEEEIEEIVGGINIADGVALGGDEGRIRGYKPSVVADSLQSVGGGSGSFSVFDRLVNATKDNTRAMDRFRAKMGISSSDYDPDAFQGTAGTPMTGDHIIPIKGDTYGEYMDNFEKYMQEKAEKEKREWESSVDWNNRLNESADMLAEAARIIIDNKSSIEGIEPLNFS